MKFKLRRELLGIILAFSTAGMFATRADANAYQEIHQQQAQQANQVQEVLASEFITTEDSKQLEQELLTFDQAKDKKNRRTLRNLHQSGQESLKTAQENLLLEEAKVANKEYKQLVKALDKLETKSQESFVLADDQQFVADLSDEIAELKDSSVVEPIRLTARQIKQLSQSLADNQVDMMTLVEQLKETNRSSETLAKKKYITANEVKELTADRKENAKYFEQANDLGLLQKRQKTSDQLVTAIEKRQVASEKDFKAHQELAEKISKLTSNLLEKGDLTKEEKETLTASNQKISDALTLVAYQPGDLQKHTTDLTEHYETYAAKSEERIEKTRQEAEAKRIAGEKAEAKRQADARIAEQAAAEEAARNNAAPPAATQSGDWYQAPAGYRYLKVDSGLTYGQVKIPGNFSLISDAEAGNYRPGRGNGWAKQ
ncbi:hypothetical protein ACFQOY_10055 [Enterococcus alcedinis]|uniref:Uncharacterized protein n=1 Tax=Enterococcus alcedinis TaxID=1274384 RepID=A0A917JH60_9ENTE|nr:hypothetical protein [Enterococcus alcedinis]MBP2102074.1 myosin heavy subunit [Enterococcus alcedinis]GGI65636.1 hypothetical protein GCM10011482_12900 [Enterococcus alcedinis]